MSSLSSVAKSGVENLPPLQQFKEQGLEVSRDLEQPVLVSLNLRNLKYFNEIYGTQNGDWLIAYMVEFYYRERSDSVLATMSYVDHLLILCEGHDASREELIALYQQLTSRFIAIVNARFNRARIHIDCGLYSMHEGDTFLYAQDNARYARRSIHNKQANTVAFYSEIQRNESMRKASIIPNFEWALDNDGIAILLQPKYSVKQQRIVGAEALSRMIDENGQEISPSLYVPVLEEVGMVSRLDLEVFRKILKVLDKWQKDGKTLFPISVNLSWIDLMESDVLDEMDRMLEETGLPKGYIEFELTETAVMKDLQSVVGKLKVLRDKGYRIALDDFGSGYNSLYILGEIPANMIKFDRGFVVHAIKNDMGMTIMKNLVDTFKEVEFEVLCEGVETKEEEERIVDCGCDIIQGFLYDRPLNIENFEQKYVYI